MNKNSDKNILNRFPFEWLLHSTLFILLFIVLAYHNRFAADDFYYAGCESSGVGAFDCMKEIYDSYSGRWFSYTMAAFAAQLNVYPGGHFLFSVITFLLFVFVLKSILENVIRIRFEKKLTVYNSLLFSVCLSALLFFSTFGIGETWFWMIQVCTYFWGLLLFLFLVLLLIKNDKGIISGIFIALTSFFLGGGSESFSLNFLFVFVSLLLILHFNLFAGKTNFIINKSALKRNLIISILFLSAGFIITMMADGNSVRYEALPKTDQPGLILVQLKSFAKIFLYKLPPVLPYLLLFSIPFFFLGRKLQNENRMKTKDFIRCHTLISAVILFLTFVFLIPTSMVMVELGPDRALSIISFLFAFYTAFFFFDAGRKITVLKSDSNLPAIFLGIILSGICGFHLYQQFETTKKYAHAFDERMEILEKEKTTNRTEVLELESLPPSGMLYAAEISNDTNHFSNRFLKEWKELEFSVKLK